MKISKEQLKKIILQEVKKITEGEDNLNFSLGDLENDVMTSWMSEYDESDPVMAEYGEDAWKAQCQQAVDDLIGTVEISIEQIHEKLHNGEYTRRGTRR